MTDRRDALAAAQSAAQALNDLGLDQAAPIDPFEAIEELGLELRFRPLSDLLGAMLPGPPAGVLINSERPVSMQRYTAAHEVGHWYLDHEAFALDSEVHVAGAPSDQRERNAQIFASHFLMPLPLFHAITSSYGVKKGSPITPVVAYELARDMHVSYQAAVHQLSNYHFISPYHRSALLSTPPAQAKSELARGHRPTNSRSDVWTVDGRDGDARLDVLVGDEVMVFLPENPSTGYRWAPASRAQEAPRAQHARPHADIAEVATTTRTETEVWSPTGALPPDLAGVSIARDDVVPWADGADLPARVGGRVTRRVAVTARAVGDWQLEFEYARPFSSGRPADSVQLHTSVKPLPLDDAKQRWLREYRDGGPPNSAHETHS